MVRAAGSQIVALAEVQEALFLLAQEEGAVLEAGQQSLVETPVCSLCRKSDDSGSILFRSAMCAGLAG